MPWLNTPPLLSYKDHNTHMGDGGTFATLKGCPIIFVTYAISCAAILIYFLKATQKFGSTPKDKNTCVQRQVYSRSNALSANVPAPHGKGGL